MAIKPERRRALLLLSIGFLVLGSTRLFLYVTTTDRRVMDLPIAAAFLGLGLTWLGLWWRSDRSGNHR